MTIRAIVIILLVCRVDATGLSDRLPFCQPQQENAIQKLFHTPQENDNQIDEFLLLDGLVSPSTLAAASHENHMWLKKNMDALGPLVQSTIRALSPEGIEARAVVTTAHRAARIAFATGKSRTITALLEALAVAIT